MDANEALRIDPAVWPRSLRLGRGMAFVAGCAFGGLCGLVAAVVILPIVLQTKRSQAVVDIFRIESALSDYALANECHDPGRLEDLVIPDVRGRRFLGVAELPRDPWGHEYQYGPPAEGHSRPRVYSLGRDGAIGGQGDDADIEVDPRIP